MGNSALMWSFGIIATLIIAFGSYAMSSIDNIDKRVMEIEKNDVGTKEVLNAINANLTRLNDQVENKFKIYDSNIRDSYVRGPIYRDDLELALSKHFHKE